MLCSCCHQAQLYGGQQLPSLNQFVVCSLDKLMSSRAHCAPSTPVQPSTASTHLGACPSCSVLVHTFLIEQLRLRRARASAGIHNCVRSQWQYTCCLFSSSCETYVFQVQGIFSGTLSYIFNEYKAGGPSFSDIVLKAKEAGCAPTSLYLYHRRLLPECLMAC